VDWLSPIREVFSFLFPFVERFAVIRAIIGFFMVFFIPGFAWSLVFFKKLSIIERITLSIALSIALVTLSILALNLLIGMRITGFNAVLVIGFITGVPLIIYFINKYINKKKETDT
jgi:uncharacterized membrane protein